MSLSVQLGGQTPIFQGKNNLVKVKPSNIKKVSVNTASEPKASPQTTISAIVWAGMLLGLLAAGVFSVVSSIKNYHPNNNINTELKEAGENIVKNIIRK